MITYLDDLDTESSSGDVTGDVVADVSEELLQGPLEQEEDLGDSEEDRQALEEVEDNSVEGEENL